MINYVKIQNKKILVCKSCTKMCVQINPRTTLTQFQFLFTKNILLFTLAPCGWIKDSYTFYLSFSCYWEFLCSYSNSYRVLFFDLEPIDFSSYLIHQASMDLRSWDWFNIVLVERYAENFDKILLYIEGWTHFVMVGKRGRLELRVWPWVHDCLNPI